MNQIALQNLCDRGQQELMQTRYLDAAGTFSAAEQRAWDSRDFDTLSRLYLPLQEARRQIRQRCAEASVAPLIYREGSITTEPSELARLHPQGEVLLAGWGTIEPALQMRRLAVQRKLYLEVFLAAVYPLAPSGRAVVIAPLPDSPLPAPIQRRSEDLATLLPFGCLLLMEDEIDRESLGAASWNEYLLSLWERLHAPFLSAAADEPDPIRRMQAYRLTLQVDPGCELAHQFLADIARHLARAR